MKRLFSTFLLVALATAAAVAQTATASQVIEYKVFSVEAGVNAGYIVGANTMAAGTSFGLNFVVADNMSVGVQTTNIGTGFNMFKLSYYLNPSIGFSAHIGTTAGPVTAAGMGAFINMARNNPSSGLANAYKIKIDYLFKTSDITTGTLAVAMAMSLGI